MSLFKKIRNTVKLLQSVDMDQLAKINQKIDLAEAMKTLGKLDDRQLVGLMRMLKTKNKKKDNTTSLLLTGIFTTLT